MRWGDFRRSDNVDDVGDSDSSGGGVPFGGGMRLGGGAIIVVVVASLLLGVNPLEMLGMLSGGGGPPSQGQPQAPGNAPGYGPSTTPHQAPAPPGYAPGYGPSTPPAAARDQTKEMVAHVLGDTEDVWGAVFKSMGSHYDPPRLELFAGSMRSACGRALAAVGPFYCSADRRVYLDIAFFNDLSRKFGAPGDFAQAYVVAHEVGHHVQNLLGIMGKFDQQSQKSDVRARNALSVRLELQADCFAGVWGSSAKKRNLLDPGDVDAGLRAAAAVGDDRIQKQSRGSVVPESFTHGSSEQRVRWFKTGLESGDIRKCNTFAAREL